MENKLIRTELILGSPKNVIGNTSADLILETLGKIYIKTGRKTLLLNDVFKLLNDVTDSNVSNRVITTNNISFIKYPGDGFLLYDTEKGALYISYDSRYLLIADDIDKVKLINNIYVKKEGDVMTGPLNIKHKGAPLIVASSDLVRNLNANYLNGYSEDEFTKRKLDELITGKWSFEESTTFKEDSKFEKNVFIDNTINVQGNSNLNNVVVNKGIGTANFVSGYNGYGWRLDSETNHLTVDYLTVRKAMEVFELVVNRISATNGSLWITDSCEVEYVKPATEPILEESNEIQWQLQFDLYGNKYFYSNVSYPKEVIDDIYKASMVYWDNNLWNVKNLYTNYFKNGDIYIVRMKSDVLPTLDDGDLVRCLKFDGTNIRYYDGLVLVKLSSTTYAIQLAHSIFDNYTEIKTVNGEIEFKDYVNPMYAKAVDYEITEKDILSTIQIGDSLVRIGNIYNSERLNSVYITSSEYDSPYVQAMAGINRPDYSVIYLEPKFKKVNGKYVSKDGTSYNYITLSNYLNLLLECDETLESTDKTLLLISNFSSHVKARFGKLDGLEDLSFLTKQPYGYGLYSDNVFLKGEFFLNNGQSIVEFTEDYFKYEIAGIEGNISTITQRADAIESTVAGLNDNVSSIEQRAGEIELNVKNAGIDLEKGTITLSADKTIINGALDINSSKVQINTKDGDVFIDSGNIAVPEVGVHWDELIIEIDLSEASGDDLKYSLSGDTVFKSCFISTARFNGESIKTPEAVPIWCVLGYEFEDEEPKYTKLCLQMNGTSDGRYIYTSKNFYYYNGEIYFAHYYKNLYDEYINIFDVDFLLQELTDITDKQLLAKIGNEYYEANAYVYNADSMDLEISYGYFSGIFSYNLVTDKNLIIDTRLGIYYKMGTEFVKPTQIKVGNDVIKRISYLGAANDAIYYLKKVTIKTVYYCVVDNEDGIDFEITNVILHKLDGTVDINVFSHPTFKINEFVTSDLPVITDKNNKYVIIWWYYELYDEYEKLHITTKREPKNKKSSTFIKPKGIVYESGDFAMYLSKDGMVFHFGDKKIHFGEEGVKFSKSIINKSGNNGGIITINIKEEKGNYVWGV